MQKADLDELTARVGALELLTRSLLGRVMHTDATFAAIMENVAKVDGIEEGISCPDIGHRVAMFRMAVQDAVQAALEISDGWRATGEGRSPSPGR